MHQTDALSQAHAGPVRFENVSSQGPSPVCHKRQKCSRAWQHAGPLQVHSLKLNVAVKSILWGPCPFTQGDTAAPYSGNTYTVASSQPHAHALG